MRFLAQFAISAVFFGCAAGAALAQGAGKEGVQKSAARAWSGVGLQVTPYGKDSEWTVVVHLGGDGGRIEYPSLKCGGTLTQFGAAVGTYRETITYGDHCVSGGTIKLYPMGDRIAWFWSGDNTAAPNVSASAILYSGEAPTS